MKICMLLHKSVVFDSRVRREAKALAAAGHDVTVAHLAPAEVPPAVTAEGYRVVSALPPRLGRRRLPLALHRAAFMRRFVGIVRALRPDVVHAHDAAMLAPGWAGARLTGARLVYDSHELATGVAYRGRAWARLVWELERLFVRRCDSVITVSDGIANRLKDLYDLRERPTVLRNVSDLPPPSGKANLRERLGIRDGESLVLHQGAAAIGRGCERLVEAMAHVPNAHLLFLGDGDPGSRERLEEAAATAGVRERVHFLASLPLEQILAYTVEADVGVSLLEETCENHRLALPNKVFEYVAAGIPVVVSDLPELGSLTREFGIGETTDSTDPAHIGRALVRALDGGTTSAKTLERARSELSWSEEKRRLTELYERIAGRVGARRAVVFVRNPGTHDARVLREARVLQSLGLKTTVVGVTSNAEPRRTAAIDGVDVVRLSPGSPIGWLRHRTGSATPSHAQGESSAQPGPAVRAGPVRRLHRLLVTLDWYRRGIGLVRREDPAVVHCNDYNTMWIGVAAKLRGECRVVYDAHELWPDRNLRPEFRGWLLACECLFVRVADEVITTSPGYADVLERRYRIPRPRVVRNVPEPFDVPNRSPAVARYRLAVYFGAITRNRGLEQAIQALLAVPDLRLRLVGPEAWGFASVLARHAHELGVASRVEILDPVPPAQVGRALADADVGLALIQPACLSYELTMPNKLLEYVCAGLPVLASDLPVIADFIRQHDVGLVTDPGDQDDLPLKLREVLEPASNERFREACHRVRTELTWAAESELLAATYGEAIAGAA